MERPASRRGERSGGCQGSNRGAKRRVGVKSGAPSFLYGLFAVLAITIAAR